MKGLLIILLDIICIIGISIAAYAERGFYTVGGEAFLIAGILCGSLLMLEEKQPKRKPARAWLTIES